MVRCEPSGYTTSYGIGSFIKHSFSLRLTLLTAKLSLADGQCSWYLQFAGISTASLASPFSWLCVLPSLSGSIWDHIFLPGFPLKSRYKSLCSPGFYILHHAWKTSTTWMRPRSVPAWAESLHNGCRGLWMSGWLFLRMYFLFCLCLNKKIMDVF